MTSQLKLKSRIEKGLHVCVGLDTDINKIPQHLLNCKNPVNEFNKIIIDNTYKFAAAYKINFAFYEKDGAKGFDNILETISYLPAQDVLTIGDAKRGDIGNTSKMYAQSLFDYFQFDSITVNPYMGYDSIEPFLNYYNKIIFVLALTSNRGAEDFEKLKLADGGSLYQKVISRVESWNANKNCGLVFGATNLVELKENINLFGELPVLLPGVGTQGGDLEGVIRTFYSNNNRNFIINVSRALIYCDNSVSFKQSVYNTMKKLNETISKII
jgi:orotidine-5'-phosphate decarboxylase